MTKYNINIETKIEGSRGCGYRKEGGLYLILEKFQAKRCGKLPLPLEKCPCCGVGIKFSRGWTWVNGKLLFEKVDCDEKHSSILKGKTTSCDFCILDNPPERMGLLWIGEKFYKTPQDWIDEGITMGIFRRIKSIPRDFKVGETWVAVAHIKTIPKSISVLDGQLDLPAKPAIFQVFKPTHIEYVVREKDGKKKLADMQKKGIKLVKVVKKVEVKKAEQMKMEV